MLGKVLFPILSLFIILPRVASAGCGCDHPPPLRGTVFPRFAWSGAAISVFEPSLAAPGAWAKISGQEVKDYLPTNEPDTRRMVIPKSVSIGPVKIEAFSRDGQLKAALSANELTVLPEPLRLHEAAGTFKYEQVTAAVDSDGTLLVPFDLSGVHKPMQFYVTLEELPLRFSEEDLVFYNKDQYNLKLFELLVDGPEDYQWGPYYGTDVVGSASPGRTSEVISYWRHEFESYYMAHLPGGAYAVGSNGLHPDGTPHIDHNNLVLSISGSISDSSQPYDRTKWRRLAPGQVKANVVVRQVFSNTPVTDAGLSDAQRSVLRSVQVTVTTDAAKGIVKLQDERTGKAWKPPATTTVASR